MDGKLILTREHGGGEVKIVTVSAVHTEPVTDEAATHEQVRLDQHSYRAKRCEAKDFGPTLDAEVARRKVLQASTVTSVNDGADWIENLVRTALPDATRVLDGYHAMTHLWKAGHAAYPDPATQATPWVKACETDLWAGQVSQVQRALDALPEATGLAAEAIRQVRDYFTQRAKQMDYARFRREGRPIGSGSVESAARNVVGWRMCRGGARWSEARINPFLALLAEIHSHRFEDSWRRCFLLPQPPIASRPILPIPP